MKRLLDYKDGEETSGVKKKGSKKSKKKVDDNAAAASKGSSRKFSKYVTEARLLGENTVNGSATSTSSIKMVSNVEFLISKLELDGDSLFLDRSSHDFQRLIAQLYYLRSLLYLENSNNITSEVTTKQEMSLATVDEEAPTVKSVIRQTKGRTTNAGHSKAATATKRKTAVRSKNVNVVKEAILSDEASELPEGKPLKRNTTRTKKVINTKDREDILSDDTGEAQLDEASKRKTTRSRRGKNIKEQEEPLADEISELVVDKLPRRKTTRQKASRNNNNKDDDGDVIVSEQSLLLPNEQPRRKKTRKRTKKEDTVECESNAIVTADEQNAQKLSDHIKKLSLHEPTSASAIPDDNKADFQPKMNESFLLDLKKVLGLLNPYTDTLIIKAIYELVAFMTSSTCGDGKTKLALTTQFLASSRTLHQQVLNSIGKKLRYARLHFYHVLCKSNLLVFNLDILSIP